GFQGNDNSVDLGSALSRLTAAERELLALRFVLDMTSDEIGSHLGISAEGARSRLHRLINRLREEMIDD
ncbi:sigma-70 family RNA polymerase sigma factor, partial [Microbacterium sp.]|uniref:sigma-70 family RNA polymerase sigma factor n=1 Tax=Microbacterium sp. TaxID=51671 RepID=UPI0031FE7A9E|nr:sigma-70 family RNA polymerase sigma factor [Microbacterium sp.]